MFHQPINFSLKPVKTIKDAFNICIELCSGHILSWEFFAGFVDEDLKTLQFVEQVLHDKTGCPHSNRQNNVPEMRFHSALPLTQRFVDTGIWVVSGLGAGELLLHTGHPGTE